MRYEKCRDRKSQCERAAFSRKWNSEFTNAERDKSRGRSRSRSQRRRAHAVIEFISSKADLPVTVVPSSLIAVETPSSLSADILRRATSSLTCICGLLSLFIYSGHPEHRTACLQLWVPSLRGSSAWGLKVPGFTATEVCTNCSRMQGPGAAVFNLRLTLGAPGVR